MTFTHSVPSNNYGTAKFIVSANIYEGTHTTIGAALTSASSGDTIFIRPGTYTENVTLKAGVNLAAYNCDALTPNVTIVGKLTATFAGSCSISGIQLRTNSDFCLAVTGSSATVITLKNCFIDVNNNTAISFTSSSGFSALNLFDCAGNIDTTGIAYLSMSALGKMIINGGIYQNNGSSVTASTQSSGGLSIRCQYFNNAITTSSAAITTMFGTEYHGPLIVNSTASSGANSISLSSIDGGSSSALTVGAGGTVTLSTCTVSSSNTNTISGAGTVLYSDLSFNGITSLINTTTQTPNYMNLGKSKATGQPAFLYTVGSNLTNKTGAGGVYTLGTDTLTKIYDQDSNMTTGGTFTAPVTGKYYLKIHALCSNLATMTTFDLRIVTTARTYVEQNASPTIANGSGNAGLALSALCDMTASDTATFTIIISGAAGNTATILGTAGAITETFVCGYLVC